MTTRTYRGRTTGVPHETPERQNATQNHCAVCDAEVLAVHALKQVCDCWGAVWFCDTCLRTLPTADIERYTREVPLRGVPLE